MNLKHAVSAGIGLFIAFIGLQNAKVVVDGATLVTMYSFKTSLKDGTFHSVGITVLLAIIGILITAVLVVKNVKGNILWGILATWVSGYDLPGSWFLPAKSGTWNVQRIPGFFKRIWNSKHGTHIFKAGFFQNFISGFSGSHVCISVC